MAKRISHVIGFDDSPFAHSHRGDVLVVGAVFADLRLEGVLSGKVRRDGVNSTSTIIRLVSEARFFNHLQAVMLQGIAFAGFNVIDLHALHAALNVPIVAVARKPPDLPAIKRALLNNVPGGARKWQLIERSGPMLPAGNVWAQGVGISQTEMSRLIEHFAVNGALPEPLRTAHLIAGGITTGESRHRA